MTSLIKHIFSLLALLTAIIFSFPAYADAGYINTVTEELKNSGAVVSVQKQTGLVNFIGGTPIQRQVKQAFSDVSPNDPRAAALAMLRHYGPLFGITNPSEELVVTREVKEPDGRAAVRFQQLYQGIPLFAGELIVNVGKEGELLSIGGRSIDAKSLNLSIAPGISPDDSKETALGAVSKWYGISKVLFTASKPELSIYDPRLLTPGSGPAKLVWKIEVSSTARLKPIRELVLVSAAKENMIALHFNQIPNARNRKTYDCSNTASCTLPGTLVCDENNSTCGGISDAVKAHKYAADTYNFYFNTHGRDSLDGKGMNLISSVRACDPDTGECPMQNAFWDGTQMAYGDGFIVDDVAAHEMTHAVTEKTSNLYYYYQSGAINESLSDVWGEFVDLSNSEATDTSTVRWLLGEDLSIGAVRNMSNPPQFQDPDRIGSSYYYKGSNDSGGVHWNSGVNNKAAYLMVDGASFNGKVVTGLGITKTAKIYYEAQTHLLFSGSDYNDLYNALNQACVNLIGTANITSADCQQVRNATDATEMNQTPSGGFLPKAKLCATGGSPFNIYYANFEDGTMNGWVSTTQSGASNPAILLPKGLYSENGYYSVMMLNLQVISDAAFAMNTSYTLPANSFLFLTHYFGFEYGSATGNNYDGGVLEYSTNGGSSWNDAGGMFAEGQNYGGSLYTGYGNPLGGRNAFVKVTPGYVSTRYDLSSLTGQSVRFRIRVGSDDGYTNDSWVVDDVRIYTCANNVQPPAAPVMSSPVVGNAQVTLKWSAVSGAISYNVYQGITAGGESTTAVKTGVVGTSVAITGLTNGTKYFFKIRAVNGGGTSALSNEVNATPIAPPATPVISAFAGDAQVTLSWPAVTGATSYKVYQGTTAGGESTTPVKTGVTGTSLTLTGLTNGKKYFFKMGAVNSVGTSALSNEVNATPAPRSSASRQPDFAVTSLALSPTSPTANGSFKVTVTVKNQGTAAGVGGYLDIWGNQSASQSCDVNGDAWVDLGLLDPGSTRTITLTLTAGSAGSKTLRAFIDSWCETGESNDSNNQLAKSYTVQ
ncbi:exported hypothetical protein [Gammaproteobacteria bacterium]